MSAEASNALSIKGLMAEWGMSYDAIYDLIQTGKLEAFKVGHKWRIRRSAISKYEKDNSNILPPTKKGAAA